MAAADDKAQAVEDAFRTVSTREGHPAECLAALSATLGVPIDSLAFAEALDSLEPLRAVRSRFCIPPAKAGGEQVYLTGHSLGLQPRSTRDGVIAELDKWANAGVAGHWTGELPWASCEDALPPLLAEVVGAAEPELEICAMNTLTVNLHMLMCAFYRPSGGRAAILIEAGAFPSDRYAVRSQLEHHGYDPAEFLIEVQPRADSGLLATGDILGAIEENQERLALVLLGGVNYLTGQCLEMERIASRVAELNAAAADKPPLILGYDLAHAVGNVPLSLHEWGVDFAAWCSYKYLNSGAGCLGALFVHSRHATDGDVYPRLKGWWGVPFNPGPRFEMRHQFDAAPGARGFACSNVNPLLVASCKAALEALRDAGGVGAVRQKSLLLTGYLELLIRERGMGKPRAAAADAGARCGVQLVTPSDPERRGCQLSMRVLAPPAAAAGDAPAIGTMRELEALLEKRDVVTDAREPDIVRAAPAPLYNSFADVHAFVGGLEHCLEGLVKSG